MFRTSQCTLRIPIIIAGIAAFHLPSRELVTSTEADPVVIPAPIRKPIRIFFDVTAILQTGKSLRDRKAAKRLEVSLTPTIGTVKASMRLSGNKGNLRIDSIYDSVNTSRAEINQVVELRFTDSNISTQFRIVHAPLIATVLAVRAPTKLSPLGGENITLVVRGGEADQRRLVLGNETVAEVEYIEKGDKHISLYETPPLPWGKLEWRMELVKGDNIMVAKDASGHVFKVASRPVLASLQPAVIKPDTEGFVVVSGVFDDSALLYVDNDPLSTRDIVHRTFGEMIIRVPSVSKESVSVSLRTTRGQKSNSLSLTFDPDALYVDAVALHASVNGDNGRFEMPFLCNRSDIPVIFARADLQQGVYEPPSFNFTVRNSTSESNFEVLSYGPDGMVPLDPDLFQETMELREDFVSIRVRVTQGERSGEAFVFVSRQLRSDNIGVTVLPPFESQREANFDVLRTHVTSLTHCENATNFDTKTLWSMNRRAIISTEIDDEEDIRGMDSAYAVGLGRTLIVSDSDAFSFSATVSVTDRSTRKTIATGTSRKRAKLEALAPLVPIVINGGLRSITLRTGMEAHEIYGNVLDADGAAAISELQYFWECKSLSSEKSKCPAALFPAVLRKRRSIDKFNVTTNGLKKGVAVEYSLSVRLGGRESARVRLRLTVSSSETAVFPSSELSGGPTLPRILSNGSIRFSCYQRIIVTILDASANDTYGFALFRNGNDTDILGSSADDLLIPNSGYWSPQSRDTVIFGIRSNTLEPGNYTLYGSRNTEAEEGAAASWTFEVQRCPLLLPYMPSQFSGTPGETTFFVGADSVPTSSNLFFFALVREEDDQNDLPTAQNESQSVSYIPGCSGSQICPFSVSAAGRYFVRVDMYDPSGSTRLSSSTIDRLITVSQPSSTQSENIAADTVSSVYIQTVQAALLQEDEGSFLRGILRLPVEESLETSFIEDIFDGLQRMASSSALVPKAGSFIISACLHLMRFEDVYHDSKLIDRTRSIVEDTISGSATNTGPGTALREPLSLFYSVLLRETSSFSGILPDGQNITVATDISERYRESAATYLPLVLAVGRECGFTDQMTVTYPTQTRFNVSEGTPLVALSDDYRVAVSCYEGQVQRLLPEPVSVEVCSNSEVSTKILPFPRILVSVEHTNFSSDASQTELLSGPTIQTRIARLRKVNDSIILEEDQQANSTCYRNRVSVDVTKELAEDLVRSPSQRREISCDSDALPASTVQVQGRDGSSKKSQPTQYSVGADGRVSAFFEAAPPVSARMTMNGTRLRECIVTTRLDGSGRSTVSVVLFSVIGVVGLFLLVIIVLLCFRRRKRNVRFSVPESAAPWDSFEVSQSRTRSTLNSYFFNSGEVNRTGNARRESDWSGQFRRMHHRSNTNSRGGTGSESGEAAAESSASGARLGSSALDQWEAFNGSRVSSMLTATDSYTTSSGDLSSFGMSNRLRLQALNALPGADGTNGFPYPRVQP